MKFIKHIILLHAFVFTIYIVKAQTQLTAAIRKVSPYILKIYTYDEENRKSGQGSGLILSPDGTCVTNYHVLSGSNYAEAILTNGKTYKIEKIIDFDQDKDLIKFKINPREKLPTTSLLTLNTSSQEIGNEVFTVGYPSSFESNNTFTVSQGIISGFRIENGNKYIQTSAPITHGSSGGGLFDYNGQLLGITQGTFADDIKDRHANLNKVVPVLFLKELTENKNQTLEQFNGEIYANDILAQANFHWNQGNFESAIPLFIAHLKRFPEDPFVWYRYGSSLLFLKEPDNKQKVYEYATSALENAIYYDSTNYFAWSNLCLVQCYLQDYEYAHFAINRAYAIAPNSSKVLGIFGQYYSYQKDYDSAIPFFTKAINNSLKNNSGNSLSKLYLERAISRAWIGQDNDAYNDYLKSISLDSINQETYWWFINFLSTRKKFSEACMYSRKLKSLNPNFSYGSTTIDKMINYTCNK
jgi:tetratricopeptide (TPR) repeat protein